MEYRLLGAVKGILNSSTVKRVVISIALMLGACTGKQGTPKGVLSEGEMVQVLMDVYTLEEKVNRLNLRRDSSETVFANLKDRMFTKLDVSDSVFKRSFDYYMDNPGALEKVYSALVDSLNLREQRTPETKPNTAAQ